MSVVHAVSVNDEQCSTRRCVSDTITQMTTDKTQNWPKREPRPWVCYAQVSKTSLSSCYQMAKSNHPSSQHITRVVACKILPKNGKKGSGQHLQKAEVMKNSVSQETNMVPTQRENWSESICLNKERWEELRHWMSGKDSLPRACNTAMAPPEKNYMNKRTYRLNLQNGVLSYYYPKLRSKWSIMSWVWEASTSQLWCFPESNVVPYDS